MVLGSLSVLLGPGTLDFAKLKTEQARIPCPAVGRADRQRFPASRSVSLLLQYSTLGQATGTRQCLLRLARSSLALLPSLHSGTLGQGVMEEKPVKAVKQCSVPAPLVISSSVEGVQNNIRRRPLLVHSLPPHDPLRTTARACCV